MFRVMSKVVTESQLKKKLLPQTHLQQQINGKIYNTTTGILNKVKKINHEITGK